MAAIFVKPLAAIAVALSLAACTGPAAQNTPNSAASPESTNANASASDQILTLGAIPDQDPERLQRQYEKLVAYLEVELGIQVAYKPVVDYAAAVTAFQVGDLEFVWFGGLTGVQARLQTPGATAIAQRDVDENFRSVFIANASAGIEPFTEITDLPQLKGKTFTFGSESSTSGRLMPQYFLEQGGVALTDFQGPAGFSGDHDKTLELVQAGAYQVGALNEKVWEQRSAEGNVNGDQVTVIWRTPAYYDYHWVLHPQIASEFGPDFPEKLRAALLKLSPDNPDHKEILDLFSAGKFIETRNENYAQIEAIGRKIGKITD
jgi:phosphonate transport system substrate-binding protein